MNEKIIEGNKLIAEFMEYKFDGIEFIIPEHATIIPFYCQTKKSKSLHCFTTTIYKPKDLKFRSSWNWLMSVVEKISKILEDKFHLYNKYLNENPKRQDFLVFRMDTIEILWTEVVEFLKWYNKQK